ncbi:MAG: hypothetical protein QNK03_17125 [Myxococcota bacterium]|nr:hypothetical protein [Myxococcota bacterium]
MLALVAILFFALLGFGAAAVDVGVASLMGVRLQTASDAVALACASTSAQADCPEAQWGRVYEAALPSPTTWTPLGEPSKPPEWSQPNGLDTWTIAQTVPLLFGQGSLIAFSPDDSTGPAEMLAARREGRWFVDDPAGGLRESGFRIRGRSSVRFAPVVRIGRSGDPGRAPFGLSAACGGDFPPGEALELSIETENDSVSSVSLGSDPPCPAFLLPLVADDGFELGPLNTSTALDLDRQTFEEALLPSDLEERTLYAPLVGPPLAAAQCQPGEECQLVGFVKLDLERDGDDLLVEFTDDRTAGNASALCATLATRSCTGLGSVDTPLTLRAPVLVREPPS